ncbi:MAG: HAD family hydrolase [Hyphomicrobiales bacterium]
MSTIKAVLFDKDGTLVDVMETWFPVYVDMLRGFDGNSEEEAVSRMIAGGYIPETHNFEAGSMLAAGTPDQMVDTWWPHLKGVERNERIQAADDFCGEKSMDYVKELLPLQPLFAQLKSSGFKLGIATNDNEASAVQQMDYLGVAEHVDVVLGFDSVENPKPAGDMVHAFCRKTGLNPENVAMVGDNSHDMMCARDARAGLAVGVLSGNSSREDLYHLADVVIDDVSALHEVLQR